MEEAATVYYDPAHPGSYGGVAPLTRALKGRKTRKEIEEWLRAQDTYTLHKPARKRFPRNRYTVFGPDELWQADLNDMRGLSAHNDGTNYLLTVIDVFSKRLFTVPLKTKSGTEVAEAFRRVFDEYGSAPKCLQTDKGTEFTGAGVKRLFNEYGVKYFTTQNPDVKAAVVERVNRTLKTRMWRYLTHENTFRYIDVLDALVNAYNLSPHRSLSSSSSGSNAVRPADFMIAKQNSKEYKKLVFRVWRHMYGSSKTTPPVKRKQTAYEAGNTVRIAKEKGPFAKGYETNWSKEVFVVDGQYGAFPLPLYTLRDLNGEPLKGRFYERELQRVTLEPDRLYQIEKVLETKGRGRNKKVLVKWVGYGDEFNSWISADKVKKL